MWIRTTNQLAWDIHPSLPFIHIFSSSLSTQRHTHIHIYVGGGGDVQSLSHVGLFATPWTVASQASLSITNSQSLLKFISTDLEMPSNHPILYCPHLLLSSVFPSIRVFSNESALQVRWPKYWSFNFSISPSNEYSGLISFGIDWLDLLAVQGILKSLLQHHNSRSINSSAFSLLYGPTLSSIHDYWKTIALTVWTFVSKVILHNLGWS